MLHLPFSSLVSLCAICLCFRDHLQASYRCKLFHFAVGWRLPILFSDCSFFLTWWCSQRISSLENTIHSSSYTEARACVIIIWSHFPSWPRNMVFLLSSTINSATGNRHTSRKSLQPSGRSTYSSTNSLIFSITSTSKTGSTSQVILGVVYSLPNSKFAGSLRDWSTWSLLVHSQRLVFGTNLMGSSCRLSQMM